MKGYGKVSSHPYLNITEPSQPALVFSIGYQQYKHAWQHFVQTIESSSFEYLHDIACVH